MRVQFTRVIIDAGEITSWDDFHATFAKKFGFPKFYGCNMNAWIECMDSLDAPEDGLSKLHAPPGGIVLLELVHVDAFARDHRELYDALVAAVAFVNFRKVEADEAPVLALSFHYDTRI